MLFNKYVGMKFNFLFVSFDVLDVIKVKLGCVCLLVCDYGFRVDGDVCVKIVCCVGYCVNDDNECEKV